MFVYGNATATMMYQIASERGPKTLRPHQTSERATEREEQDIDVNDELQ